jgi:O-methyltransferase involved in polyketide biosynthesis
MRDFSAISQTALAHIYFRSFYTIAYAKELADLTNAATTAEATYGQNIPADVIAIMEARYKGGEAALTKELTKSPQAQVVELAAGFSLHGLTLAQKFPTCHYYDTDYSLDFVSTKQKIITKELLKQPLSNLHFGRINALEFDQTQTELHLDKDRPLIIYCEGLMSYLDDNEKHILAKNIKSLLQTYGGAWITPDPSLSAERRKRLGSFLEGFKSISQAVEKQTKQKYDDYGFASEAEADVFFGREGFTIDKLSQPTDLSSFSLLKHTSEATEISNDIQKYGKVWRLSLQ